MGDIMETFHRAGHKRYKERSEELERKLEDKENEFENYRERQEYFSKYAMEENARLTYFNILIQDIVAAGEEHTLPELFEEMHEEASDARMPWQKILDNYMDNRKEIA